MRKISFGLIEESLPLADKKRVIRSDSTGASKILLSESIENRDHVQKAVKSERKAQVVIPQSLFWRIETRLAKIDFKTVDEYVGYVLEQVLDEVEKQDEPARQDGQEENMTKEEQEVLEQRLRDLGYL